MEKTAKAATAANAVAVFGVAFAVAAVVFRTSLAAAAAAAADDERF